MIADVIINPPPWIELSAVVVGAIAGALFATRRGLDLVGVLAIAIVAGLGGGMIRDILLSTVPAALTDPAYLVAVVIAAVVGAFFALGDPLAAVADERTGIAVARALRGDRHAESPVRRPAGRGGDHAGGHHRGLWRRPLARPVHRKNTRRRPSSGHHRSPRSPRSPPRATCSWCGGWTCRSSPPRSAVGTVLVVMLRLVAIWRGWTTPAAPDITPRKLRPRSAEPSEPREPGDGQEPDAAP